MRSAWILPGWKVGFTRPSCPGSRQVPATVPGWLLGHYRRRFEPAPSPFERFRGTCSPVAQPTRAMPGPYPGRVVEVGCEALRRSTVADNPEVAASMLAEGMARLVGGGEPAHAWRRFFSPSDVVGIKVNCGGYPYVVSDYAIVA